MEYAALLRGINVGGKTLKMDALVQLFKAMGFDAVRTYIQSGNVLFSASAPNAAASKQAIEARIKERSGLEVTVILRTRRELKRVLEGNPFLNSGARDPERMHVTFLEQPAPAARRALPAAAATPDEFFLGEREVYVYCPGGYGKTLFSNAYFEKTLGVKATTRNWRTVNKLYELLGEG